MGTQSSKSPPSSSQSDRRLLLRLRARFSFFNHPRNQSPSSTQLSITTDPLTSANYKEYSRSKSNGLPINVLQYDEPDRLHYILLHLIKQHYLAPLNLAQVNSILDLHAGNGLWCMEMAIDNPQIMVIGTDIDFIRPKVANIPGNCQFKNSSFLVNMEETYMFDFIHSRFLAHSTKRHQWPLLLRQLHKMLTPEGYIELVESNWINDPVGIAGAEINGWVHEYKQLTGLDECIMQNLEGYLSECGFHDIVVKSWRVAMGSPGGRLGEVVFEEYKGWIKDVVAPKILTEDRVKLDQVLDKWTEEVEEKKSYWEVNVFVAKRGKVMQRPPTAEEAQECSVS